MANIVNTPIVMYVDGHNLILDESTASELIENNKYDIKIYTNENLDGSDLVRKTENDQTLSDLELPTLEKEVKRLLRSQDGDEDGLKWWVYLEKEEGQEIQPGEYPIYSGMVKTYKYEEVSTIFFNTKRRDKVSINELGLLKVTLGDDFNTLTILSNPATGTTLEDIFKDSVFMGGILTTDFQNIPEPELRQVGIEFPEEITLKDKSKNPLTLNLNDYSNNFNFTEEDLKSISISVLSFNSYSEEEGIYYYSKNIPGLSNNVKLKNSGDTTTYTVEFEIKIECKINENNFSDFSLVVYLNLKGLKKENTSTTSIEEEIQEDNNESTLVSDSTDQEPNELGDEEVSEPDEEIGNQAGEELDIDSLNENLEISLNVMEIIIIPNVLKFLTKEFDMEEIFLQETGDDYANIYIVKDFEIGPYNNSGLNEIALGVIGTNYETNSVILTVAPGINGTSWPVTTLLRNVYIIETTLKYNDEIPTSIEFSTKEADSLYIQKIYKQKDASASIYDPQEIRLYLWSPVESSFKRIGSEDIEITPIEIPTS